MIVGRIGSGRKISKIPGWTSVTLAGIADIPHRHGCIGFTPDGR